MSVSDFGLLLVVVENEEVKKKLQIKRNDASLNRASNSASHGLNSAHRGEWHSDLIVLLP